MSQEFEEHVSDILGKADVENIIQDPGLYLGNTNLDLVNFIDGDGESNLYNVDPNHMEYMEDMKFYNENKEIAFFAVAPRNISNDEYSGPYEFEVSIIPNSGSKNPWEYSTKLNKLFVDMGNAIPVDFSLGRAPSDEKLYVRATPRYSQPQFQQEGVYRCINHEHQGDPANKDLLPHVCQHIVRCSNQNAIYLGNKLKSERLSVLIPLAKPQTGTDSVTELYQFVCKSSCPGGMNRRPIEIIFTLENLRGQILGRRSISVRICSCPKRDKGKEEAEQEKAPQGKKRKLEPASSKTRSLPNNQTALDSKVYQLNLKVAGKENYKQLLECASKFMGSEVLEHSEGRKTGDVTPYRNCYNEAKNLLNSLSGSS